MPSKTKKQTKGKATTSELVIARVFDAPRERVWKAWTEPEQAKQWWGPKGFTAPFIKIDFRVGGKYLFCMRSPEGKDYWGTGVYREIVPLEKFVATDSFADSKGKVVPASYYGMDADFPLELLWTVTFEDLGGKTKMTLRHSGFPGGLVLARSGAEQGWSESFEKLAASLAEGPSGTEFVKNAGKRQLVMSRIFDAPRKRVFQAYTDAKLIPKWWGPRNQTTRVDAMDVREGGKWRYVSRDTDGAEFAFRGVYKQVVPPERLVSTFEYEGMPGHIVDEIATFEDLGNRTRLTITSQFASLEDLEGMLASGMESGARETWDRLAELLASL